MPWKFNQNTQIQPEQPKHQYIFIYKKPCAQNVPMKKRMKRKQRTHFFAFQAHKII